MPTITADKVHEVLRQHLLVDGFRVVCDLEKSSGSYLYDAKNQRRILDFYTNFASSPIGFNHPKMEDPEWLKRFQRVGLNNVANSDLYTVEFAEYVRGFTEHTKPASMKYLFFVAGGALAVENALKTAFDWKIRKTCDEKLNLRVLHLKEAFHGRTGYTLSLTNTADPRKTKYFPKFDWPRVDNPKLHFPVDATEEKRVASAEADSLAQIEAACKKYGNEICAFIMEPIQGEGGDNHFRREFFHGIRDLAKKYDFMFILDEVQTGIGMTGKMWAYQYFDFEPDMICFGKKTQVCGFYCGPKVDEVKNHVFQESSRINSTWGGNLVDMWRGWRFLEIIKAERLIENAARMGALLTSELTRICSGKRGLSNIRGRGLFIAFDCADGDSRDKYIRVLLENGLKVLASGQQSIRLRPPLNLSENEIMEAVEIFERSLK